LKAPSTNTKKETEEHVTRLKKVFEAALPSFLPGASRAIPRGHAARAIVGRRSLPNVEYDAFFNDFRSIKKHRRGLIKKLRSVAVEYACWPQITAILTGFA
jgi:hypothetical protein